MLAYIIAESFFFGGIRGNRNGSYTMLIGMGAFAVYFLSQLLILNLSRSREYFADMHSAQTTKKPENLASALSKITYNMASSNQEQASSGMARSFYIADSFSARKDLKEIEEHADEIKHILPNIEISKLKELAAKETGARSIFGAFATHPPTYKRILALARIKSEIEK